ncbi:hypothetical protein TEK04_10560 [Klenkia sp. LSe6-5]|uniref:Nitroreductase family protein n=1 Tax=Klenkia sesuvii TaxID=3103137 RepID=A0ABU8DTI8_9ACTN
MTSAPVASTAPRPMTRAALRALRDSVDRARCSPSVEDSQPWRWLLLPDRLELHADRSQGVARLDPVGRELVLSLGSVLLGLQVAAAGRGTSLEVDRTAVDWQRGPTAVLRPADGPPDRRLSALSPVLELRRTTRTPLVADDWPSLLADDLRSAAADSGAALTVLAPRTAAAVAGWTAEAAAGAVGPGRLRVGPNLLSRVPLAAVSTAGDGPEDWLRAGEAVHRVLLEITRHGFQGGPSTRVTEEPDVRALAGRLACPGRHLQALVRIGRGLPAPGRPPRRGFDDVLTDRSGSRSA